MYLSDCSIRPYEVGQRAVISPDWSRILPDIFRLRAAASGAEHAGKHSARHTLNACLYAIPNRNDGGTNRVFKHNNEMF